MLPRLAPQTLCRPMAFSCQRRSFATPNEIAKDKPAPSDLYEPKIVSKKIYPVYQKLNLRLRGYDYVVLENYQSFVHKMAKKFGFEAAESFATAARTHRAVIYKPRTSAVESECELAVYERTVQIDDAPAVRLQLLLDFLRTHLPSGVELTAKEHTKEDEDARYIPDMELKAKQAELKSLDDPVVRRGLGWDT